MFVINWIKQNKLVTILLLFIIYLFAKDMIGVTSFSSIPLGRSEMSLEKSSSFALPPIGGGQSAPAPNIKNRLVVSQSALSLLVSDVIGSISKIKNKVETVGGYMVEVTTNNPQDAVTGSITVRVPKKSFEETLAFFRSLSLKVVSENLSGTDFTDEFVDIEAKLNTLIKNKARFEEIMARAQGVEEIMQVQQQVFNIQDQIDSLRGRQKYIEQTSENPKITAYLSTDELALPYTPSEPWRPSAIFKQAVRSLFGNIQNIGTLLIWVVVYAVIFVPLIAIVILIRRKFKKQA